MGEPAWARHFQEAWADDALNPIYPMPLRVAFLAFGRHRANGHAIFGQGEIANTLGHHDDVGGWVPADRRTVHRAITKAVSYGLLDSTSKALCLVVPKHRVAGGMGNPETPCRRHPATRTKTALKAVK